MTTPPADPRVRLWPQCPSCASRQEEIERLSTALDVLSKAVSHNEQGKLLARAEAQAEQIATLQAENARLEERVENLKFDMNLVGAQLGISTREEIEPAVRKLLTAIDRAEAQLREARAQAERGE
jgi:hypothetical protein